MAAVETPQCEEGATAPDFALPDPTGVSHSLAELRGERGTVVMFICNHCPFVKAVIERIVRDCRELEALGVRAVAIMPNDVAAYPADAPEHMAAWARELGFPFPYLYDEDQAVARAYGAVCTPDFFGYDDQLRLRYRGRLDASRMEPAPADARRELYEAMVAVAAGQPVAGEQLPSMGCSIKWKRSD